MSQASLTIIRGPNGNPNALTSTYANIPGTITANPVAQPSGGNPTSTPTALNELDKLLLQLSQGGTSAQQKIQAERLAEIDRNRTQQGQYSKQAAMSDAQALMDKAIQDALRIASPQITAAAEGAGASKSTLRAQMLQEAATRGAIEGAAQGTQLASAYGQQYNQLAAVLENLTRQDPNSPTALLAQTIVGSKGIIEPIKPVAEQTQNQATQTTPAQSNTVATNPYAQSPYDAYDVYGDYTSSPTNNNGNGGGNMLIVSNPTEYNWNDSFLDPNYPGNSTIDGFYTEDWGSNGYDWTA